MVLPKDPKDRFVRLSLTIDPNGQAYRIWSELLEDGKKAEWVCQAMIQRAEREGLI